MSATLFFDGYPEPPGSLGAAHDSSAPSPHPAKAVPMVATPTGSGHQGRHRPRPQLALAVSVAGMVLGHLVGVPWPDALALVFLVAATTAACAIVAGVVHWGPRVSEWTFGLVPAVVVRGGSGTEAQVPLTRRRPLRPQRHVYVVGGEQFCRRVSASAGGRRRVSGYWVFEGSSDSMPKHVTDQLSEMDELVIDGGCFNALSEGWGWTPYCKGRVRVIPTGWSEDAVFAEPLGPVARLAKRTFDIVFSLIGLLLVAPCLLLAMLAIRLDSRGPALFRQVRVGEGGRRFTLYKLRTMTVGDEDPAVLAYVADMVRCEAKPENGMFKLGSNRRITRVGRWLRRLSIDEVPQLLNVLKGEMSLVGPRPPILEEAACYNDFHWQRLGVRPGITGLAQVSGRSRLRFDDIVALDIHYSRSWTPLMELKIILRTPAAVVSGRGAT